MALETGLESLPSGHPLIIELCYVLGYIHGNLGDTERSKEYFQQQLHHLNLPRTSIASMVDVVEIADGKMHYICPRCHLPVWVYPTCRIFKGKPCGRCLRKIFRCRPQSRVSPI